MSTARKKLTSKYTFSDMIEGDCLYVDKTEQIYHLFGQKMNYYFLSRPRRFGKSLLVSTIKELFAGNRKLFKNLWIDHSDWDWQEHPVIHLDFSLIAHATSVELKKDLMYVLDDIAQKYAITLTKHKTPGIKLRALIEELSLKNKVVILIDEYDKPIIDHISNLPIAEKNRDVLKSLYDVIKGLDEYLRAIFVTGVSKFAQTSLFSGMNNLNDISHDPIAASLLGYTEQEVEHYLTPFVVDMAEKQSLLKQDVFDEMQKWYNGYRFSTKDLRVYNPFSVLYYLTKMERGNYWIRSGTPTFLVTLLKKSYESIRDFSGTEVTDSTFNPFELSANIPLIPLLYQTGYLTIRDVWQELDPMGKNPKYRYRLDYPNQEVRESFLEYMLIALTFSDDATVEMGISAIQRALKTNNIKEFCREMRIMFAQIPYQLHIKQEDYYHSIFQAMLYLIGVKATSEISTSKGRLDMLIRTLNRIYVFELKFNKPPKVALKQINRKKYYEKFENEGLPITLAGISFDYVNKELVLDYVEQQI